MDASRPRRATPLFDPRQSRSPATLPAKARCCARSRKSRRRAGGAARRGRATGRSAKTYDNSRPRSGLAPRVTMTGHLDADGARAQSARRGQAVPRSRSSSVFRARSALADGGRGVLVGGMPAMVREGRKGFSRHGGRQAALAQNLSRVADRAMAEELRGARADALARFKSAAARRSRAAYERIRHARAGVTADDIAADERAAAAGGERAHEMSARRDG